MHAFYSDTQTRATREMRASILDIPLGDERHDADPKTTELCERVADMFGMEAAMFLPSGTMCNEIAIAVHCRPGDEVICARESHIIFAESGGPSALSGVMMHPLDSPRGLFSADQVEDAIRPRSSHAPRSRLLITEQTSNLGGGAIWPLEQIQAVRAVAAEAGLATHLDGARILNASVASGVRPAAYAKGYDSGWLAFTKGLGCPVGAVLCGSRDFIRDAWLFKRRWGGAMRQTGVLTAMCLYALDHHVERLADDHALAQFIGEALAPIPYIATIEPVETNIVHVHLSVEGPDARSVATHLKDREITVTVTGKRRIRIVTHLDVDRAAAQVLIDGFASMPFAA